MKDFIVGKLVTYIPSATFDNTYGYIWPSADTANLPSFDILLGGLWLEILPNDITKAASSGNDAFCINGLNGSTYAYIGTALHKSYYVIHDMENMKLGFAPLKGAN